MNIWNLAGARSLISKFQLPDTKEHVKKREFLEEFIKRINQIEDNVKETSRFKKLTAKEIKINKLKNKFQRTHHLSHLSAHNLLMALQDEMQRYYREEIHLKSEKSDSYLKLLNHLMKCCLGIINNPDNLHQLNNEELVENYFKEGVILYDFCAYSGGQFLPSAQRLDPLCGSYQYTDNEKYTRGKGNCYGHVMTWAKQLAQNGKTTLINVLDAETNRQQNEQKIQMTSFLYPVRPLITNILNSMDNQHIYRICVGGNQNQIGHAMSIRRTFRSNFIEFFDPNHGIFVFPDEEAFKDFFVLLISLYNKQVHFSTIDFSPIGMQKIKFQKNVEMHQKKNDNSRLMEKHTTKEAFQALLTEWSDLYQKNHFSTMEMSEIKENFFNNITARLKHTTDVTVLRYLHTLFSADDKSLNKENNKDYAIIRLLKTRKHPIIDKMSFWKKEKDTQTISTLKTVIALRIKELRNKNVNVRLTRPVIASESEANQVLLLT